MARPKLKLLWGSGTASPIRYLLISYNIMLKKTRKISDNEGSLLNENPFYMPEGRGLPAEIPQKLHGDTGAATGTGRHP